MLLWVAKRSVVDINVFSSMSEELKWTILLYFERLQQVKLVIFKLSSILKQLKCFEIF